MHVISGINIVGIATRFPRNISRTDDYLNFKAEEADKFKKIVGISERRIVDEKTCTSDLCEAAIKDLLFGLGWTGDDVDALIMITQTGDYPVPATSIILQNKLGIKNEAICFDVNLGCSSFPYGLYIVSSFIKSSGLNRALLVIGDVSSKVCSYNDKSAYPLFGDAGSVIALEKTKSEELFVFDLMADGSGFDSIIIESGGLASRFPANSDSFTNVDYGSGIIRNSLNLTLKGADIFSFAISKVPLSLNKVSTYFGLDINDFDFLVLHQANKMINDQIVRKIKIDASKSLSSLEKYGNTSSVSIPLTITANSDVLKNQDNKMISCGFGVGLSWGSVAYNLTKSVYYSHLEY